jgi:hypothetical protein
MSTRWTTMNLGAALTAVLAAALMTGCGEKAADAPAPLSRGTQARTPPAASALAQAAAVRAPPAAVTAATPMAAAAAGSARPREVLNPDKSTMVFVYFDLAGMKPPIDEWVENDARVRYAPPLQKAARRAAVRAELESGLAAARGVGRMRVSLADAGLSDYDPSYGEFTVRALGPGSELVYETLGQKVRTRFGNGETAQLWKVPPDQAQSIRDRVARGPVHLDVLLKVTGVQPGPGGGEIDTSIEEYTLHIGDGSTLARIRVGGG